MRQLIAKTNIKSDGTLIISGDDYAHLCKVLRAKVGDMIYVRSLEGELFPTTVCKIIKEKKSAVLQICAKNITEQNNTHHNVSANKIDSSSQIEYTLFQFIAKMQKMETIIRQATECGIKTIVPVIGEFSQKNNIEAFSESETKKMRLQKIIKEAREQSGSPIQTKITPPLSLGQACTFWENEKNDCKNAEQSVAFVLSELQTSENSFASILQNQKESGSIRKAALAVGSEGGISASEIEKLSSAGFTPVHFKGNILRCETAALYGIAALQSLLAI